MDLLICLAAPLGSCAIVSAILAAVIKLIPRNALQRFWEWYLITFAGYLLWTANIGWWLLLIIVVLGVIVFWLIPWRWDKMTKRWKQYLIMGVVSVLVIAVLAIIMLTTA